MLTVHASGGEKMLQAPAEAARSHARLMVLGVTVLTSMGEIDLEKIGMRGTVEDSVARLATLANGCHGVVASARGASTPRAKLGADFRNRNPWCTPGRRPVGDQVRVVTLDRGHRRGRHIVVGRPITEAADPAAEAKTILKQIDG